LCLFLGHLPGGGIGQNSGGLSAANILNFLIHIYKVLLRRFALFRG
jgi:hypothetical protein